MIHVSTDHITSSACVCLCVVVKRDIQESDEEAVRVKEQSILELGGLLAKTGQAAGNQIMLFILQLSLSCTVY